MATMKLYELVNFYHIDTDLTCAEAMFRACNEYYGLHLSEETRKMFSVMGIGMQTEVSCCGAFTVAVGIIGLMTAKEGHTDVDNMEGYQLISELTLFMLNQYETLQCAGLQREADKSDVQSKPIDRSSPEPLFTPEPSLLGLRQPLP